jgi:xylan 1,4-beta-xylosidase
MMSMMGGDQLTVDSDHAIELDRILRRGVRRDVDVSALASLDAEARRLCVLARHYHDDDLPGDDAAVSLVLDGAPAAAAGGSAKLYRIDATHSNAFTVWKEMGSPQEPTEEQYAQLVAAGDLAEPESVDVLASEGAVATINTTFMLPRQGVALVVVEWDE